MDANGQSVHNGETKSKRLPCWPFDKCQPLLDTQERFRLFCLKQNSPECDEEWPKRQGASSSSCTVGLGPATPRDYWRLKTGRIQREDTEEGRRILQRGHDLEPVAAHAYEGFFDCQLAEVGIVVHPKIPWIHASPDRLIARGHGANCEGLVEIKCPIYGLPQRIKDQYMCQVQQQMECTGARWCDLFSYYKDDGPAATSRRRATDESGKVMGAKCWRIWRSREYWKRMLWSMERFADCLMEDREPTPKDIPLRPTMPPVRYEVVLEWRRPASPRGKTGGKKG